MIKLKTLLVCAALVSLPVPAFADKVRNETVKFEAGSTGTMIEDRVKGRDSINYKIGASAGQTMTVELTSRSDAIYFNVFEPGKMPGQAEAMFIGSTEGSRFAEALPASGDYLVQVYLVRSAAKKRHFR